MAIWSLLKKELHWSRHRLLVLAFLLLLVPALLVSTSLAFQNVLPRDASVAVTPENDAVTEDELTLVEGGITLFSDPEVVSSTERATDRLRREEVYAVIQVPPGITDSDQENASFVLYVEGSNVPFTRASQAIRDVADFYLGQVLPADVSVERVVVGDSKTLSEYLVPIFLFVTVMLFAFTFVPYNLANESAVLDRVRAEASLEALLGAKLVYFTGLMLVPILFFQAVASQLGYAVTVFDPVTVGVLLLTFAYLAALSMAIMVVTGLGSLGRFVNAALFLGLLGFSGLAYPVGYFSPLRKLIVRAIPTHYSMIVTRSSMLKSVDVTLFADWLVGLVVVTVGALGLLKLSAVYYRRVH